MNLSKLYLQKRMDVSPVEFPLQLPTSPFIFKISKVAKKL